MANIFDFIENNQIDKVKSCLLSELAITNDDGETPCHVAARLGRLEILECLITRKKVNVNALNKAKCTPLHSAAFNGHYSIVKLLLENGADVDAQHINGATALHAAAHQGHADIVQLLISYKAKTNIRDGFLETAIFEALNSNSLKSFEILLEISSDVDEKNAMDETLLSIAVTLKNYHAIKLLLARKANPAIKGKNGNAAIHKAAKMGDIKSIALLLDKADINLEEANLYGLTPLLVAAHSNNEDAVKYLLQRGANILAQDKDGRSALHYAASSGNVRLAMYLKSQNEKIIPLKTNKFSLTAFDMASMDASVELLDSLYSDDQIVLDAPIDVRQLTRSTRAFIEGHMPRYNFLIKKGASHNPVMAGAQGASQLHLVCQDVGYREDAFEDEFIEMLLSRGIAKCDLQDAHGNQAIHYLASNGFISEKRKRCFQLLISFGADINARNNSGTTPIFFAITNVVLLVAEFLIEKGADLGIRNNSDNMPILQLYSTYIDCKDDITKEKLLRNLHKLLRSNIKILGSNTATLEEHLGFYVDSHLDDICDVADPNVAVKLIDQILDPNTKAETLFQYEKKSIFKMWQLFNLDKRSYWALSTSTPVFDNYARPELEKSSSPVESICSGLRRLDPKLHDLEIKLLFLRLLLRKKDQLLIEIDRRKKLETQLQEYKDKISALESQLAELKRPVESKSQDEGSIADSRVSFSGGSLFYKGSLTDSQTTSQGLTKQ